MDEFLSVIWDGVLFIIYWIIAILLFIGLIIFIINMIRGAFTGRLGGYGDQLDDIHEELRKLNSKKDQKKE